MPVSRLVEYFNDRIRAEKLRYLPEDPIRLRNGVVEGYFGAIRLESIFEPRVTLSSGVPRVLGHAAALQAYGAGKATNEPNRLIPIGEVYASARDADAVVYLDRLCRLVHTLNYLRQVDDAGSLFLRVDSRHVAGVHEEHGRYFEEVLERCGLTPDRVVIVYSPAGTEDDDRLARIRHALMGYRHRNYPVALDFRGDFSVHQALKYAWLLLPNYVQIEVDSMTGGSLRYPSSILRELGIRIVVSKVRTAAEAERALARGADLLAGDHFGAASGEVRFSVETDRATADEGLVSYGIPQLRAGYI